MARGQTGAWWLLDDRTKMPDFPVGKDYLRFVFFVLAMHATANIVCTHDPQTSQITRRSRASR
jgi:hypothetical protein